MEVASAIAGLIGLADIVAKLVVPYVLSAKGAKKEIEVLQKEMAALGSSLENFKKFLDCETENGSDFNNTSALLVAVSGCKDVLESVKNKLEKRHFLIWPFSEADTNRTAQRLHEYLAIFHFSLSTDGL